jgi:hypothetical protein
MEMNGQLHALAALPPEKEIGDWVDLRVDLDALKKRKNFQCRKTNPGRPARSPSLYLLRHTDPD